MKKVPYTSNRNYRDLGTDEEENDNQFVENIKKTKKSKFEEFKKVFKNIFKK